MAETGGLENRIPGNRDEGSNPSPSANSTFVAFSAEGHSMSWIERFFRTFWPQLGPAFTANRVQTNHEIRSLVRLVRLPAGARILDVPCAGSDAMRWRQPFAGFA